MGKTIIITAGPTNERIDSVMQITNMSTGSLGAKIASAILDDPEFACRVDKIYYIAPKLAKRPSVPDGQAHKVHDIVITTAQDLLNTLGALLRNPDEHIDAVVHSAAVGDYKAKYSVRGEDLANEIAKRVLNMTYGRSWPSVTKDDISKTVMDVLDNPACAANDSGKMSSYEPHLMTMMDLTPKVIGSIKPASPDTLLIGFKLLDGVSREKLVDVASVLLDKNGADVIMANDLSKIGNGKHWALAVTKNGVIGECFTKDDIAHTIIGFIFNEIPA